MREVIWGQILSAARSLDDQLAALLSFRDGSSQFRWSSFPAKDEVISALFLARFASLEARDVCDQLSPIMAASYAVKTSLPDPGTTVNHPPRITSAPITGVSANQAYHYQVIATDSDGDNLTYKLVEGPAGAALDASGNLTWSAPVAGTYSIRVRVDDGQAYAEQHYALAVQDALAYLDVQLNVTPAIVNPGDPILVSVTLLGEGVSPTLQLSVDGTLQPLDANGQAHLVAAASGAHRIVVTVSDQGKTTQRETQYTVRDPNDTVKPSAGLTYPTQDTEITKPIDFIGSANDANFAYYQLVVRPAGDPDSAWREIERHYQPVTDGILGRFDPTQLPNGLYDVGLNVVDVNGQTTGVSVPVEVLGNLKLGMFRISFEDLNVDAAGIPVRVTRTYDSLRRNEDLDFGWGWSVDYQDVSLRKNMTLGLAWEITNVFREFKLCLRPAGKRKVSIALPDGKVERFTAYNEPECAYFTVPDLNVQFNPQAGTTSKLEIVDDGALVSARGGMLVDMDTGAPWNPVRFKLTTAEGYVYYLKEGVGIEQVKDPYGNTLTYGPNGILHSAGLSVSFERDAQGRITQITDPQGKAIRYSYNNRGELTGMADREGAASRFSYAAQHLLADYTDPRGVKAVKQVYDDNGRLVAQIDADGQRTELAYQDDAHQQTVRDRLGQVTTYIYDDFGNVTSVTDPLGLVTSYTYDALGNETSVTDPLGHTLTRTFDAATGQQLSESDPLGNTQTWTYNTRFNTDPYRLLSTRDAKGNATSYKYQGSMLSELQEPLGRSTGLLYDRGNITTLNLAGQISRYGYNAKGQRVAETDPAGHTVSYTLDANGRETGRSWTRTAADGQVRTIATARVLDAEGRVLAETDAAGATTTYRYNSAGKVIQETDALGRITRYEYDTQARPVKTLYPDGRFEATTYDASGNVVAETDRAGRTTRTTYDALNRPVKVTAPDGTVSGTVYDAAGRVVKSVDAQGHATEQQYDAAGRLIAVIESDGQTTRYEYDANGNRTKTILPDGQFTLYAYDALNRLVETTYPDGTKSSTVWRADGLKQSETDPKGTVRAYAYDAAGRLNQVQEQSGTEITVYAYDEAGNKLKQTDAAGRVTRWDYDDANRLTARMLPGGETERFQYDAAGRLVTHTAFDGQITRYDYDGNDRLVQAARPDGLGPQWTYDETGQVTGIAGVDGATQRRYDLNGNLVEETRPDGTVLSWAYDAQGNVTERSTPSGTSRYSYDAQGHLIQVTGPKGEVTTYAYDAAGRLQTQGYPNGVTASYRYDVNGRLTQLLHRDAAGAILTGTAYGLAADGTRTELHEYDNQSRVDANGLAQNPLRSTQYRYDGSGRLTQEAATGRDGQALRTVGYSYDKVGNRRQKTVTTPQGREVVDYTYDANDRLTQESKTVNGGPAHVTAYSWDANGRLVKKAEPTLVTLYRWDSEDHLLEVKQGTTEATAQIQAQYAYDADGHRVQKTEKTAQGDKVTHYLIDATFPYAQVVEETMTLGRQTETAHYLWGNGLIAQTSAGQGTYYHADGLGSVKALTDAQGQISDAYDYDAFGAVVDHLGSSSQPYRFAGEHYDADTQMQYHWARWYDTYTGRFTAMDPFSGVPNRPATLHKYAYAGNDPVNKIDPSGLMTLGSVAAGLNGVSTLYSVASIAFDIATGNIAGAGKEIAEEIVYSKMGGAFGKSVVKLTKEQFGLFYNVWKKHVDVSRIKLGVLPPNSKTLTDNLEAVGVPKPSGTQAHHIVGGVTQVGKDTQAFLQSKGIDLNSAMNGVFLPGCGKSKAIGMTHCGKHTEEYEKEVANYLDGAQTKEEIINRLNDIRNELLAGSFKALNKRAKP